MKNPCRFRYDGTVNVRLKIFLSLGVLILVLVTVLSAWSIYQLGGAIQYERKSKAVETVVQSVYQYLQEAESAQRKFLLTSRKEYQKNLANVLPRIPKEMVRLGELVEDDDDQEERFESLQELIDLKMEALAIPENLPETERGRLALAVSKTEKEEGLMREIHQVLDDLDKSAKKNTLVYESFAHRYTSVMIAAITTGSAIALLLVLAFGYLALREIRVRRQTEEDLKAAREAALIASRLKSQFLATVSHEIRTPLNGIIGTSDLLKTKIENPEHRRYLEIICNSGDALLSMVNDILDFAKIEAGRTDFEVVEFSVLRLVQQVSDLFSVKAQEKHLSIETFVDPDLPVTLSGDSSQILRVLSNLVGNAVKFTSKGGVFVRTSLESRASGVAQVRFEVRDTGPGVESSIRALLFQPFNSFGAGGKKHEGSGLGLSICKQLVEQMNGKIGFEPIDDGGTCFWFEIPLAIASKAVVGELKSEPPKKPVAIRVAKSANGELILLVEDNVTNQILAKAILEDLGYQVHVVANGAEALEAMSRVEYALILMDGQMPVMDGFETTKKIRENEKSTEQHIPIVAMTANASEEDRQQCLQAGMDDFIAKPFKSAELHRKVEKWLGRDNATLDWEILEELGRQTNSAVVDRLINSFLTTLPQTMSRLKAAMNDDDWEGVRKSAHHLKSSASSLGATRLAELCDQVEKYAGHSNENFQKLVIDLLACGDSVESELKLKRHA